MQKLITTEQINAVLGTIYQTNVSASNFDAIKKFFNDLPNAPVISKETPVVKTEPKP